MRLKKYRNLTISLLAIFLFSGLFAAGYGNPHERNDSELYEDQTEEIHKIIEQGKQTFRYDTFGDERFWGGQLRLHKAISGESNGGIGEGISPNTALALGLKVDVQALPKKLRKYIKALQCR